MPQWVIKSISNQDICTVKSVEKHGQLMNGRWLTVDIDSAVKLALSAGCYIEFEGIRYSIRSFADVEKSARQLSHGGAFLYKGLRLDDVSWQALEDTQMCDYVYGDNHLHYSGLGTFSFFASKASDVGYRVLANLRNKYGSSWNVLINGEDITDNYEDYTFDEGKLISISSGTSVKEALDLLWSNWGVYYKVGYRTVDIITSDREPGIELKYGKDEGLKSIRRKINPNVEICTRVRAYGSERNMPYKWYNNKYPTVFGNDMYVPQLMLPHYAYVQNGEFIDANGNLYTSGGQVNLWGNPSDIVLPSKSEILTKYGSRDKEIHWNSDDMGEIFPSMKGMTATDVGVDSDTWADDRLDLLLSTAINEDGTAITGTGETSELTTGKINFVVRVPNPGFDPMAQKGQEDVVLLMQSGKCQSRGFVILKSEAVIENEQIVAYDLTCVKTVDDEIDQVFPNGNYTINGGEEYVYTGLTFNDESSLESSWLAVYIGAAEKRLLRAAAIWLREHQTEQYVYEITPDNIYLQRQKDEDENFDITEGDFITQISFLRRDESESLGDRVKGLVGQTISVDSDIAKMNDAMYKKVNKSGFHTLFDPLDAQYNVLDINGDLTNLKYIRANVDFFSIKGVAALGTTSGGGGGGGGDLNEPLASINDAGLADHPSASGQTIVWNGSQWTYGNAGGGGGGTGTVTSVTAGTGLVTNPSSGITATGSISIANNYLTRIDEGHQAYGWGNHANQGYLKLYSDGVVEGGQYYDFHMQNTSSDFSTRIQASGNYGNTLTLPSADGTLALVSQIPTSMPWSAITSKPDTIQGYGISDAYISTINGVTSVTLGDDTFTPAVTYNNSATLTSPYYVVTSGSLSGNTLTLGRRTLASILNASGYSWWGQTMNSSGVVKGGLQYAEYIEFNNTSGAGHGGHLDFHFNGSSADYTSRIIESSIGKLSINSVYMSNGNAVIGDSTSDTTHYIQIGGGRIYWNQDNNSLYVQNANGTPCNFYSLGGIAALGATSGSGGLTELTLGKLNVTGEGVLFDDGDGVSKIYSYGGMLTFECEEDVVFGSSVDMNGKDISNATSISASSLHTSGMLYINQELAALAYNKNTGQLILRTRTSTSGSWTNHVISMT